MIATTDRHRARDEGEARKAAVLADLAERRGVLVNRARRALLTQLLSYGTATADGVRSTVELPPGLDPRFLGTVPGPLVKGGVIALEGYTKTARPERHASVTAVWRLADRQAAIDWLRRHPDMPDPVPAEVEDVTLFDLDTGTKPTVAPAGFTLKKGFTL